ncbi:MazG-like family protein [Cytobacillus sp. IB215665]|uniref:MazG-like family protein n=1 Tax=Cytobacillus sp. IB215665 TaxID=3097357 RepID=UPI002A10A00B|nr:MazG-like family protein [Cytobacillus sp. IB215665]MDX8367835.1 MazG-like family protein [Cytobacillus sp. IB215665]
MNKKKARLRVNNLLDRCQDCPIKPTKVESVSHVEAVCNGCTVYQELLQLGKFLGTEKKKGVGKVPKALDLSVGEYFSLKKKGLKEKEIAEIKGVTKQRIYNWKYARREELNKAKCEDTGITDIVLMDVAAERVRQEMKWGKQRHSDGDWLKILVEEVGEVAQAMQINQGWGKSSDASDQYKELIHVAAVAVSMAEQIKEGQST